MSLSNLKRFQTYNPKTRIYFNLLQTNDQTALWGCQTNTISVNTPSKFKLLSWKHPFFPMKLPFVVSCGIQFFLYWWNNILIRKQSLGQPGSFPSSLALSYLLEYGKGGLTCPSDSLLCSGIIFVQLTAYWLCDIFTRSDLTADLNA